MLAACSPQHTVDAAALQGVMVPVLDRHDGYVSEDSSLELVEKEAFLRSSTLIRQMVETALLQ
jgi:hypothetical protein